jgi:hypothetical protein
MISKRPHLLPYDPVQKKRSDHAVGKRGAANISDMTGEEANVLSGVTIASREN